MNTCVQTFLMETTFLIVKPDGLQKGVVGELLNELNKYELEVISHYFTRLPKELVEELYLFEKKESYYEEVVTWVSSGTVLILLIQGRGSIEIVKWKLLGRYPNGLRGKYAENWIKNIAHAPDSVEANTRELNILKPLINTNNERIINRRKGVRIFALSGLSESGKSTISDYLNENRGFLKIKIVDIFKRIKEKMCSQKDLYVFIDDEVKKNPFYVWDLFIDELFVRLNRSDCKNCTIESLYGGGLGPFLKRVLNRSFHIVFVTASKTSRIKRQMHKENLQSLKDAAELLDKRDQIKIQSGILDLKPIADFVIDNSGTMDLLYSEIKRVFY